MSEPKKYTLSVGIALVIANMIGTGVFTSLGYQVGPIPSGFAILMLWTVGGVVALSGAFTYAEIATTLKKSGGEYFYLGKIFHPALGFVAGWMSLLVGFAGAISAVAIAIGAYSTIALGIPTKVIAVSAILVVSKPMVDFAVAANSRKESSISYVNANDGFESKVKLWAVISRSQAARS